jgi:hypothetical protein
LVQTTGTSANIGDDDDEYDIPEELEDILHHLLTLIKDKDTIVRFVLHFIELK